MGMTIWSSWTSHKPPVKKITVVSVLLHYLQNYEVIRYTSKWIYFLVIFIRLQSSPPRAGIPFAQSRLYLPQQFVCAPSEPFASRSNCSFFSVSPGWQVLILKRQLLHTKTVVARNIVLNKSHIAYRWNGIVAAQYHEYVYPGWSFTQGHIIFHISTGTLIPEWLCWGVTFAHYGQRQSR